MPEKQPEKLVIDITEELDKKVIPENVRTFYKCINTIIIDQLKYIDNQQQQQQQQN